MSADDLDRAMDQRRIELRMRWNHVADKAGMVPGNLRKIRSGEIALTEFAARGIDEALEWAPGTAAKYYTGQTRPAVGSREWILRLAHELPAEDFREVMVRLAEVDRMRRMMREVLAERDESLVDSD